MAASAQRANEPHLISACLLRDRVQALVSEALGKDEHRPALGEPQLTEVVRTEKGAAAAAAYARVAERLRKLPSRGQAAAPWGGGFMSKREFDALYDDCAALCRNLGCTLGTDS
jgi:hypothetical protein